MKAVKILGLAVCALTACNTPCQIKHDYAWVPVESAVGEVYQGSS